jgi:putative ABC transport system permease protein
VTRLYGWLLALYPAHFRARFEADMRETFARDHARALAAGTLARIFFVLRTVGEAVWFGLSERLAPRPYAPAHDSFSGGASMSSRLAVDWRDAWRSLRATPIVTAVAVLSLALGIGANTALFSILNGLVLRELPVRDPQQLVTLRYGSWTNPIWEQLRAHQPRIAAGAFAWSEETFDLSQRGQIDEVTGAFASGGTFDVLGLKAARGRLLTEADDTREAGKRVGVAVVSYGFWQSRLAGAADVVGKTLMLNRVPFTIVGVMPAAFTGVEVGTRCDIVFPIANEPLIRGTGTVLDARSTWWLDVMFRLRPGQTLEQAQAALEGVRPQIREATMPAGWGADMLARYINTPFELEAAATGRSSLRGELSHPLVAMMIVVGAVLLIACANIANVLLARATARRRDLSVRLALGASRWRIGRQLFYESLMLSIAGAALGLLIAQAGSALFIRELDTFLDTSIDWRVLAFTAGVGLLTAILFGIAPAFSIFRVSPNDALKENARTVAGDRRFGVRNALVVVQVALSLVLVVAAGLFIRTFQSVSAVPLGLKVDPLLIARVDVTRSAAEGPARRALYERLRDAAAATPGVRSVALSRILPLSGAGWNTQVVDRADGLANVPGRRLPWVNGVTPGWFDTFGLRVLAGRDFTLADRVGGAPVAVTNQAFARRYFNGQNPVGQRVTMGGPNRQTEYEVVGLVSDSVYRSVREGAQSIIFVPYLQMENVDPAVHMAIELPPGSWGETERRIGEALSAVDAGVAFSMRPMADRVRGTLNRERLVAILSGSFGALALLLAGVGLYGLTSYGVSRRRTEIGVRMALGAEPGQVVRLVLVRSAWLVGLGVALGAGTSLWVAKYVGPALLFGLQPRDPATLITAAIVLVVVGLLTAWLPARRASRIDPTSVLRES